MICILAVVGFELSPGFEMFESENFKKSRFVHS